MTTQEDIFVTSRIVAFGRYIFISRKEKKSESLEQFHADLVEPASRAACGDREDEWARDMFTAHMNKEKIAEEILAQTRSPQDGYEYAIRRENEIEHSRTMKINPFRGQTTTIKQEPVHYINTRGRKKLLKQSKFTKRPGWFPRSTVSMWNTKHKGTATTEHKHQHSKTMLQIWKTIR